MRLVIDMQGAQTESRFRGIGRYSLSLAQSIVRNRGEHEVILVLSGHFPETIEYIRNIFNELLPQKNIRVWYSLDPVRRYDPLNTNRSDIAELVREAFIASLKPNVVLITSLFEGWGDDAVVSVGRFDGSTPVAVVLYDLIPLISPDVNFRENKQLIEYYNSKIESLKRSSSLLAISESSRDEAIVAGGFDPDKVINISAGYDKRFEKISVDKYDIESLKLGLGIQDQFLMYVGGADERKNLPRLIEAYSKLPQLILKNHQLVFVGKMPDGNVQQLKKIGKDFGLKDEKLIFTGYLPDVQLKALYTACAVFVFPSLHEGFGLPPLEAMSCGTPVITSNSTSLPEVIGFAEAMFDASNIESITNKISQVILNNSFRQKLINHGLSQIKKFTWDRCARKTIKQLEKISKQPLIFSFGSEGGNLAKTGIFKPKFQKILVIKLDHLGDLLLAAPGIFKLKARYPEAKIDALVGTWNVELARSLAVFDEIYTLDFFSKKSSESPEFHEEEILEKLKEMIHYDLAIDLRRQPDTRFILNMIPASLHVGYSSLDEIIDSKLDICLPAEQDVPYKTTDMNRLSVAIQLIKLIDALPSEVSDFISLPRFDRRKFHTQNQIAIFPFAGNDVKEWGVDNYIDLILSLNQSLEIKKINIYVVNADQARLFEKIKSSKVNLYVGLKFKDLLASLDKNDLCVGNNSMSVHLASFLGLKVIGIYGGHETVNEWAPVFGSPVIVSYSVPCSPCHIAKREACSNNFECLAKIKPNYVYEIILKALENNQTKSNIETLEGLNQRLLQAIAPRIQNWTEVEKAKLANQLSLNIGTNSKLRIFVDVSELIIKDAKTGIQRVVRSVLSEFFLMASGFEIYPVYAMVDSIGYRYAGNIGLSGEAAEISLLKGKFIDFQPGDIFLGLDLNPQIIVKQADYLKSMRNHGVRVIFVVYDLLCINLPHYFDQGLVGAFKNWLAVIRESDGAICISKSVSEDLAKWIQNNPAEYRERDFQIGWFHLGADIENSIPTIGLPENAHSILKTSPKTLTFLVVGTLEPRKGHAQLLDAFELLWAAGREYRLIIVGKKGWNVDHLIHRIESHPETNSRLIWPKFVSDEYLEKIYEHTDCLIVPSEGEGFGLPIIEASKRNVAILARDIPVFREVAGEGAYYFSGLESNDLATAIEKWACQYKKNDHPLPNKIKTINWKKSASDLMKFITNLG